MSSLLRRVSRAIAFASVCALGLMSCGGGGGGGSSSGGGSGSLRFTPDRTTISFDYVDTQQVPWDTVIVTATGNLPNVFYIGAQDQSGHLDPEIRASLGSTSGRFEFRPSSTLAPGTYNGTLRLMACSDQACTRQIGNSPVNVTYGIRVRPGLRVTPPSTPNPVTYTSGGEGSVLFTVQLPEGATTFTVDTINTSSLCHIADVTATTFRLVANYAPSGNYLCQWRVDAGSTGTLGSVNFEVLAPVGGNRDLDVQEPGLTLTSAEGGSSAASRLHVTPASWDSRYEVEVQGYYGGASDWVRITRTGDGFEVLADATNLPEGAYGTTLRVYSPSGWSSQEIVPVSLTVGPGLVRPADVVRVIDSESVAADLAGNVAIDLVDGPQSQWSAVSNAAWLTLPAGAGQTGGNLSFNLDNAAFRALINGREHVATITVTTPNPAITPMSFDVRVSKRLAQVTGLGPYLQVAGRPVRAYVRGVGFSSMANLSRMQMAGVPSAAFTLVNDTTLVLDVAAGVPAGEYAISASNSLGFAVQSRTLKAVTPVSYSYAALTTGLPVGNINYDAERQRVYISSSPNYSLTNQFVNWQYGSGAWTPAVYPLAVPMDLGFSPDGSQVYLVRPGYFPWFGDYANVYVLDANTLDEVEENPYDGWIRASVMTGRQIPVTNDGRVWLGAHGGTVDVRETTVFDSINREYGSVQLPGDLRFDSLTYEVPRDGSKIFVGEVMNTEYRVGRYDATTSTYVTLPAYQERIYNAHSSDDGSRVALGGNFILNSSMEILQSVYRELVEGTEWLAASTLLSPDGRRAYVLAIDTNEISRPNNPPEPPQRKPRVYVLDTTSDVPTPDDAAVLGYFEIDDYPICRTQDGCDYQVRGAITPDGGTLFFAGQDRFVVVPLPAESSLVARLPPPRVFKWEPAKAAR
jgi:hypothetical protein